MDIFEKKLARLENKQSELITRIAGLTDEILLEQCQEEYNMNENEIKNLEKEIYKCKFDKMIDDHIAFYTFQYKREKSIITALEKTNNIDIRSLIRNKRLREPKDLSNRRELCMLATELKKNIVITDMENINIDTIGPFSDENDTLKLIVGIFSKWQNYETFDKSLLNLLILDKEPVDN